MLSGSWAQGLGKLSQCLVLEAWVFVVGGTGWCDSAKVGSAVLSTPLQGGLQAWGAAGILTVGGRAQHWNAPGRERSGRTCPREQSAATI